MVFIDFILNSVTRFPFTNHNSN